MNPRPVLALVCFLLLATAAQAAILNASFEQPTTTSAVYDPVDPTGGWTFLLRTGVAQNTFFTPPPPGGTQAAFIQQYVDESSSLSSIAQNLTGLALTPSTLSFYIAERPGFLPNPIVVTYGSQNLGTFTPGSTTFTQVMIPFTPTSSSGTLTFQSAASTTGDLDTAIDLVSLTAGTQSVPEPATWALLAAALAAGCLLRSKHLRRAA